MRVRKIEMYIYIINIRNCMVCRVYAFDVCDRCQSNSRASHSSRYYSCSAEEFRSIIVGSKIVAHHTPWLLQAALDSLLDNAAG